MTCATATGNQNEGVRCLLDWEQTLDAALPLFGHRNWLVVADSAYPSQSRAGIQTVFADADHELVTEKVLGKLRSAHHVRPVVYLDRELTFVDRQNVPGVSRYREWLGAALTGLEVKSLPHEEIIAELDRAGQTFSILIIKTNMRIPYTSIFLKFDCAYWDIASEEQLRCAMNMTKADVNDPDRDVVSVQQ